MIPRYSRPEMVQIWSQDNKYQIWFDIEIYALEALEKLKLLLKAQQKEFVKILKIWR